MGKQKRSSRELAEQISQKILERIQVKQNRYERAADKQDIEGMFINQLQTQEWKFIQQQQKLDQDADAIDANSGYLNDMDVEELDEMYEKLHREDQEQLDLPPPPNLDE